MKKCAAAHFTRCGQIPALPKIGTRFGRRRNKTRHTTPSFASQSVAAGSARFLHLSLIACLIQPLVRLGRGPVELNDWTPIFFSRRRIPVLGYFAGAKQYPARTICVSRGRNGRSHAPHRSNPAGRSRRNGSPYFTCPETSLVISNMLTDFLPLKTA